MVNSNRELILVGHQSPVASLAFTRDGTTLISAADGCVIWWNTETGKMYRHLRLSRGAYSVTLCPDDSILVTDDWQVYDAATARLQWRSSRYAHVYAFSPDGGTFACASYVPHMDGACILITDTRSGRELS